MSVNYRAAIYYGIRLTDDIMSHLSSDEAFEEICEQDLIHYTDGFEDSSDCILGFCKRVVSEDEKAVSFELHDLAPSYKEVAKVEKAWKKLFPNVESPYADYFLVLEID